MAKYSSLITKKTIPSIYDIFHESDIEVNHQEIWYNVKNHFRTEQIVQLCEKKYINVTGLEDGDCDTIDRYFEMLWKYFNEKMTNKMEMKYHRREVEGSVKIGQDVYKIVNGCTAEMLNPKGAKVAEHVYEYMSHLSVIAAMRASADTGTTDYFSWSSQQMATLVIVADAITEYNSTGRDVTYAHICQALIAKLLTLSFDRSYAVMTEEQREPSIVKKQFWRFGSDIEHRPNEIIGSETNAAYGLYRSILLGDTQARTLTLFNSENNFELSRRAYRIVREYVMLHPELMSDTCTIVCSCEISYVNPPAKSKQAMSFLYSITDKGLLCYSPLEVILVLGVLLILSTDPVFFLVSAFAYKSMRFENWTWYDFVRCRYYNTTMKHRNIPELIRIINDDKEHFSTIFNNDLLLGQKSGRNHLETNITASQIREAGMLVFTDGINQMILDPLSGLDFYKYNAYRIDRTPCRVVRPLQLVHMFKEI